MIQEALPYAALTLATGGFSLSRTAIEDHRLWTHRSIAFQRDRAERVYRVMGSHLTDTKRWASVHRIHHPNPDANLEPFVEFADFTDWHNSLHVWREGQAEIPDTLHGMDPALPEIESTIAYEIGSLARDRVGGKYQPKLEYTKQDSQRILHGFDPRYLYESNAELKAGRKKPIKFDPANPPSLHEIRFLLRDPHSPALHRRGIPGILVNNVPLYSYAEKNFEDPAFRDADLLPDETDIWIRENRAKVRLAYVGGMALTGVLLGDTSSLAGIAKGALKGDASAGLAIAGLIAGGNITNAFGHAGDTEKLTFNEFLQGVVYPKADGTYTNNDKNLSPLTLDEVGGQWIHHLRPDLIAYALKKGWEGFKEAPFGTFLTFLTENGIIFKPGDNFNGQPRPDLPSEAVLLLQETRAKHLARIALPEQSAIAA